MSSFLFLKVLQEQGGDGGLDPVCTQARDYACCGGLVSGHRVSLNQGAKSGENFSCLGIDTQ